MQNAELNYFRAVDAASNDDRLLNWTDIGYTGSRDQNLLYEKSRSFEAEGKEPTYSKEKMDAVTRKSHGDSCHNVVNLQVEKMQDIEVDNDMDHDEIEPKMGRKLSSSNFAAACSNEAASFPAYHRKPDDVILSPICRQKQHSSHAVSVNQRDECRITTTFPFLSEGLKCTGSTPIVDAWPVNRNHCEIEATLPFTTILKQSKSESNIPRHPDPLENKRNTKEECSESDLDLQKVTPSMLRAESPQERPCSGASYDEQHESFASDAEGSIHGVSLGFADDHDGNAWCECVCSRKHGENVPRFWIQCDNCQTWYFSSSRCLTFTEEEAPYIGPWSCWGCPDELCDDGMTNFTKTRTEGAKRSSPDTEQSQYDSLSSRQDSSTKRKDEWNVDKSSGLAFQLSPGDTVKVEEHAWPGVNNPEGFAKILKAYVDEDGDFVYDIKYIVGGRRKGVLAQFLKPHSFG
jgi:hypothetical protein